MVGLNTFSRQIKKCDLELPLEDSHKSVRYCDLAYLKQMINFVMSLAEKLPVCRSTRRKSTMVKFITVPSCSKNSRSIYW